ncbi:MAG: homocysteine methyltransferase [Ruminococcus sp.]|nr:homocysteine methyltransferase [Ruminococcus sp.]
MDIKSYIKNHMLFLDGGMGTQLQENGLELGGIPEMLNFTNPELITSIHRRYIDAGSDIVYTNSFGANRFKMSHTDKSVSEIIKAAIKNAKKATEGTNALVALDIGPIGQLLEPTGSLKFEEAYDIFKEQIIAGRDDADLIVFETMTDLYELKAGVLAAKENSDLPVFCTMTFEENMRTFTGCCIPSMAMTLEGLGVDAIGINCSLGPRELLPLVEELRKHTSLPLIVKPNAGLPDPVTNKYEITPEDFLSYMKQIVNAGASILGGCCGTTPAFIKIMKDNLTLSSDFTLPEKTEISAVCTPVKATFITEPRIIGERINPTGKKRFKEALMAHDIDYILSQALEQTGAGADILDVNVGLPNIDEKEMMISAVKAIQSITDVPLQIDSTIPEVIESALRVYNGKAIVNSVNGEDSSLETIIPIVKKYGAAVVGLTLDKNGIPKKADDRFKIAKKIIDHAVNAGMNKSDIYIDCLTLTASAEQEAVMETLKAVKRVREELGVNTVLGVSNISFGLPDRELINHTFLTMALSYGLTLPIINPNIASMTGAVRAFKLLSNIDKNSAEYISAYGNKQNEPAKSTNATSTLTLEEAIEKGLKNEASKITAELLQNTDPMTIINEMIIPALDKAGKSFEAGTTFLPQLILSAESSQASFEQIKKAMASNGEKSISKGKIVLATVKGDVHDIGKNIVKVLLENYGYTVIDLGKDVEYQAVVDAIIKHDVKLVGLSALMTTTLVSMENTIKLIRENGLDCKVMVGGAVLTPDYAMQIGADFYAKDAKESVDIAKKVLG